MNLACLLLNMLLGVAASGSWTLASVFPFCLTLPCVKAEASRPHSAPEPTKVRPSLSMSRVVGGLSSLGHFQNCIAYCALRKWKGRSMVNLQGLTICPLIGSQETRRYDAGFLVCMGGCSGDEHPEPKHHQSLLFSQSREEGLHVLCSIWLRVSTLGFYSSKLLNSPAFLNSGMQRELWNMCNCLLGCVEP